MFGNPPGGDETRGPVCRVGEVQVLVGHVAKVRAKGPESTPGGLAMHKNTVRNLATPQATRHASRLRRPQPRCMPRSVRAKSLKVPHRT